MFAWFKCDSIPQRRGFSYLPYATQLFSWNGTMPDLSNFWRVLRRLNGAQYVVLHRRYAAASLLKCTFQIHFSISMVSKQMGCPALASTMDELYRVVVNRQVENPFARDLLQSPMSTWLERDYARGLEGSFFAWSPTRSKSYGHNDAIVCWRALKISWKRQQWQPNDYRLRK